MLDGTTGHDAFGGGLGIDSVVGGMGDDLYIVDAVDIVVDLAGGGIQNVQSACSGAVLPREVDLLVRTTTSS